MKTEEFLDALELLGRYYEVEIHIVKSYKSSGSFWHITFHEMHGDDRGVIYGHIDFRFVKDDLTEVLNKVKEVLDRDSSIAILRDLKLENKEE